MRPRDRGTSGGSPAHNRYRYERARRVTQWDACASHGSRVIPFRSPAKNRECVSEDVTGRRETKGIAYINKCTGRDATGRRATTCAALVPFRSASTYTVRADL